ncbi:MAG: hypothetical protein AAF696_06820 [Bacteroidota bacterium]
MGIIIHTVKVIWTKESRSYPGASKRNGLPEIFPFQEFQDSDSIYWQGTIFGEYRDFRNPIRKVPKLIHDQQLKDMDLAIEKHTDEIRLSSWIKSSYPKKLGNLSYNNWC